LAAEIWQGIGELAGQLFEQFPYGLAIVAPGGEIEQLNQRGRALLLAGEEVHQPWSCCELICSRLGSVLGSGCMTQWALEGPRELPEIRVDLESGRLATSAWITASVLCPDRQRVLFHLRPGRPGDRRRRTRQGWHGDVPGGRNAELQVKTLGGFSLEGPGGPLGGEWLEQRTGEALKYLICERRRPLAADQICEALWPSAGHAGARNRLRFQIHALRERIEPERERHAESRFIRSRRGGYVFDTALVWIDADEFEREARAGLAAWERGDQLGSAPHLARAGSLFGGDFLPEDPYADWAQSERERLRELATSVLTTQVRLQLGRDNLEGAGQAARRLAELEPFDEEAQRLLIRVSLIRGRRSEAARRYDHFRARLRRSFGAEPDFDLRDVERSLSPTQSADSAVY
jgi:DNA-binding SARP family transcriptional activator